jgi:hypothetical protein
MCLKWSLRNEDDRGKRHDDSGQQPAKYQNGVDRRLDVGAARGLEFPLKSERTLIASEHARPTISDASGSGNDRRASDRITLFWLH